MQNPADRAHVDRHGSDIVLSFPGRSKSDPLLAPSGEQRPKTTCVQTRYQLACAFDVHAGMWGDANR